VFVATNEICDEKDNEGTKDSSGNDEQGGNLILLRPEPGGRRMSLQQMTVEAAAES